MERGVLDRVKLSFLPEGPPSLPPSPSSPFLPLTELGHEGRRHTQEQGPSPLHLCGACVPVLLDRLRLVHQGQAIAGHEGIAVVVGGDCRHRGRGGRVR